MSSIVEGLENEDFSKIAAPIYGRGFVKLYCETVGLDPKPLVAEFMEIYNGNREPSIRERKSAPEPPPVPAPEPPKAKPLQKPEPVTAAVPPDGGTTFDLFSQPQYEETVGESKSSTAVSDHEYGQRPQADEKDKPEPVKANVGDEPPEPMSFGFLREPAPRDAAQPTFAPTAPEEPAPSDDRPVISRYTTPMRDYASDLPSLAPAICRWTVIAVVLALVLWGIIAGVGALYRATAPSAAPEPKEEAPKVEQTKPMPLEKPAAAMPRTPQDIPPLYID